VSGSRAGESMFPHLYNGFKLSEDKMESMHTLQQQKHPPRMPLYLHHHTMPVHNQHRPTPVDISHPSHFSQTTRLMSKLFHDRHPPFQYHSTAHHRKMPVHSWAPSLLEQYILQNKELHILLSAILWYALYAWDESFELLYSHLCSLVRSPHALK